jgi:hypothetical protein
VHASPVAEQVWPVFGQLVSIVHVKPLVLQCPASVTQFPSIVQAMPEVEHVPGRVGHSAGSLPVTWHTAAGWRLQWLARAQGAPAGSHALPSTEHVAPATGQVVVQVKPVTLQCEARMQAVSSKHDPWSMLHCPGSSGHSPASAPAVWHIALVNVQWPSFGHSPGSAPAMVQLWLSVLQWPAIVGQLASTVQVARVFVLQFPRFEQLLSAKQPGVPSREHVPGCCGHSAISGPEVWQALPRMLHVPTLGQVDASEQFELSLLHFPGGQVNEGRHAWHSSPVHGQ